MQNIVARMVGAARLSRATYEEVEADTSANGQAVGIVVLYSLAAAIGANAADPRSLIGILVVALLSWVIWVLLTLFIGTRLLPESTTRSDFGEILRTTGFSTSVGILLVFGRLPVIGGVIVAIVGIWMLVTFVVAIRQALDYSSTARALAVCVLGWVIHWVVFFGFSRTLI
ncbi:MAG TPA: YIP1 family protein [Terriglobia bacterium]|nr:YIP1 family protein [Terriglobia bacterium]